MMYDMPVKYIIVSARLQQVPIIMSQRSKFGVICGVARRVNLGLTSFVKLIRIPVTASFLPLRGSSLKSLFAPMILSVTAIADT